MTKPQDISAAKAWLGAAFVRTVLVMLLSIPVSMGFMPNPDSFDLLMAFVWSGFFWLLLVESLFLAVAVIAGRSPTRRYRRHRHGRR